MHVVNTRLVSLLCEAPTAPPSHPKKDDAKQSSSPLKDGAADDGSQANAMSGYFSEEYYSLLYWSLHAIGQVMAEANNMVTELYVYCIFSCVPRGVFFFGTW